MTTFERFERSIPELMSELAPARVPHYFDDMLLQTAAHRQRPAWSFPERWLPVDIAIQPLTSRRFPWRPLLVVALIGLLIGAGLAAYIGSQQRLPPPFGPARNGAILLTTPDGEIVTVDPGTLAKQPLISGPELDSGASFSPDGQRLFFVRVGAGLMVADADGSDIKSVLRSTFLATDPWIGWSQDSRHLLVTGERMLGGFATLIVDPVSGSITRVRHENDFWFVAEPYGRDILVLADDGETRNNVTRVRHWVMSTDGSGLRQLPSSPDAINAPALSADGSSLAYAMWDTGAGPGERIHVIDIESGNDRVITPDPNDGYLWQDAYFSPDGRWVVSARYDVSGFQLAAIPVDGSAAYIPIGPRHVGGSARVRFSPDGTQLIATYSEDESTWLLDIGGGEGQRFDESNLESVDWQRLAP